METDDIYLCHKCGKIFYKLSTLESHSKWKHAEKTNEFMCDQCGRTFQKKYNLIKHLESAVHDISESVNCALCDFKSLNRKLMCEHYQSCHCIPLKETNVYFKTAEEFFVWKGEFEIKTKSRFVKMSSSRMRKNGYIRSTYFCHRDGNFIPKGRNLRHMKVKGSNKINAHCPAKIEVEMGERITIVSYIDTHLGHNQDISRMSIDPADKVLIARKLALKVPFEQILDEVNSYEKEGGIKRVHLLTRKDLWNIVDSFKINPKNVVFSKNRIRRKKRIEDLKREGRSSATLKIYSQNHGSVKDEKVTYDTNEEEEYTDRQIVSIKQEGPVICPVDEHNQYIEEYSVMAGESDEGGGTCLIINANGELESITGHKIIYTEDGNIEICEDPNIDETEIIDDGSALSCEMEDSIVEASIVKNEETDNYLTEIVLPTKSTTFVQPEIITSKDGIGYSEKIGRSAKENLASQVTKDQSYIQLVDEEEVIAIPEAVDIKIENNEDMHNESLISLKDNIDQYEVTISNYEGEDVNEYVIISTEDAVEYGSDIDSTEVSTMEDLGAPMSLETVVLSTNDNEPECSSVSEEVVCNVDTSESYISSNIVDGENWNIESNDDLQKVLTVQNLNKTNSEQQLHVFSSNISSIENVIEALSKGNSQD